MGVMGSKTGSLVDADQGENGHQDSKRDVNGGVHG
jgi:hypothetical protein